MSFYDTGYYVSMAFAIVGAMVAVFLFFFLDIRQAIKMSSGKQRKKRIQEKAVQYSNQDTSSDLSAGQTPQYIHISEDTADKKGKKNKKTVQTTSEDTFQATPTPAYNLNTNQTAQASVTSVLKRGNAGSMTTVLQEPGRQNPTIAPNRRFEVIQNIMVIHTTEKI